MLIHYIKAAEGDVSYIKNLIEKDKNSINALFDGIYQPQVTDYAFTGIGFAFLTMTVAVTGPLAVVTALCAASVGVTSNVCFDQLEKAYSSRKNWTLLDFAAENGKIEVARLLIKNGANTANRFFLQIAASNNHHMFVEMCSDLLELEGKLAPRVLCCKKTIS